MALQWPVNTEGLSLSLCTDHLQVLNVARPAETLLLEGGHVLNIMGEGKLQEVAKNVSSSLRMSPVLHSPFSQNVSYSLFLGCQVESSALTLCCKASG